MKVVGVCGSPRRGGNCEVLLDEALAACAEEGAQVEKLLLAGMDIDDCVGCIPCPTRCATGDDATWDVAAKLKEADGIILASPVYGGSMSGLMKSFLDRTIYILRKHQTGKVAGASHALANKVGASIAVGASSGMQFVNLEHVIWFLKAKMFVATWDRELYLGLSATAHDPGEIVKDRKAMEGARALGRRVVEILRLMGKN